MSFYDNLKIAGGCLALLATYAFAQHQDDKARAEDEALYNKSYVAVSCEDVQGKADVQPSMECAP